MNIAIILMGVSLLSCIITNVVNSRRISNLEDSRHTTKQLAMAMKEALEKNPELAKHIGKGTYSEGATQKMLDAIEIYKQIEKAKALGLI
jgi:flagellar biosynthesis/type III secretory pathway ATPase